MSGLSNAAELLVLDGYHRVTAAYQPAAFYLALFTTNPDFDLGTGGVEATGGGYVRKAITWGASTGNNPCSSANTNQMTWTLGTDIAAGTYKGYGIYSASGGGTFLSGKAFAADRVIAVAGDKIDFAVGAVVETLN